MTETPEIAETDTEPNEPSDEELNVYELDPVKGWPGDE